MANAKLETRLNKRKNQRQSVKLNIKDRWYYLSLNEKSAQIISYDSGTLANTLNDVLKPFFEKVPACLKINNSAIHLLHHIPETTEGLKPTAIYAGNPLYGQIYVVATIADTVSLEDCDFMPFSTATGILDSLWFPSPAFTKVELVLE